MIKVYTIIFAFTILYQYTNEQNVKQLKNYDKTIKGVSGHDNCNCIFLIETDPNIRTQMVIEVAKLISLDVYSVSINILSLIKPIREHHKTCSHTLIIVLESSHELSSIKSEHMQVSGATWLLFLPHIYNVTLEDFFSGIDIPFDCQFLVAQTTNDDVTVLTEVYRVARHLSLKTHNYGAWSAASGFRGPEKRLFSRRNNLKGLSLTAGTVHDPPITIVTPKITNRVGGFCGDVLRIVQQRLNYKLQIVTPMDDYGVRFTNGSWTGLPGLIQRREVDFGITSWAMSKEVLKVVDYATALRSAVMKVYIREPDEREGTWSTLLAPFSPTLWLSVVLTALTTSALTQIIHTIYRQYGDEDIRTNSFFDELFDTFGCIFCGQGISQAPNVLSSRVVYIVVYLVGVIIIASYSAVLTSLLTVFIPQVPFKTLEGLRDDGSYALGSRDPSVMNSFKTLHDPLLNELYLKNIAPGLKNVPTKWKESFQKVCDGKYAFIVAKSVADGTRSKIPCNIFEMPVHFQISPIPYAAFPKRSPYKATIDHVLLLLYETGVFRQEILKTLPKTAIRRQRAAISSISLDMVTPILSIILGGIILANLILVLEKCFAFAKWLIRIWFC